MTIERQFLNKLVSVLSAVFVATIMSTAAQADEVSAKPTVAFIENAALGRKIDQEDYKAAIDGLEDKSGKGMYAFYAANNLCVAKLKMGYVTEARAACDKAVSIIRGAMDSPRRLQWYDPLVKDRARYLAIALSNRGVVNAAVGQDAVAQEDFASAIEVDSGYTEAKTNLTWLQQRAAKGA